ncbi:DUF4955 domain-containing protein [Phocaeicola plebeius]|uniref:DUF4955 domain-containing protein n=1 Tax=Phocaeicola plebeius TaxID=310297 RepID=UPI0026F26B8E|nr:DUF4955 domain-containing protein [Phocaeicola plebeius]
MKKLNIGITLLASLFWFSCSDEEVAEPAVIPEQPEEVASLLQQYNTDVAALQLMAEGGAKVTSYTENGTSGYKVMLDNSWTINASASAEVDNDIPVMGINEEGYWVYQLNGTQVELTDIAGNKVPALKKTGKGVFTPQIALGEDGCWKMSLNGVQWKNLSTDIVPSLKEKTEASYSLFKSTSVTETGTISLQTAVGELALELEVDASAAADADAWNKFVMQADDNVLLDFSYAGYMHGEVAPPDVMIDFDTPRTDASGNKYYNGYITGGAQGSAIYKVYNIEDYGANGNDEVSDRPALIKILKEAMGCKERTDEDGGKTLRYYIGGDNANAIIYFPVGKYILRGGDNAETVETLRLTMGNIIFKGAGRNKTTIEMAVKNNATDPSKMWSTPNLLEFKHNSDLTELTTVTGNAEKGTFSIEVASTSGINVGDWICVSLKNNDPALVAEELAPHATSSNWTELNNNGVQIYDYHQVKHISGNTLTFYEPIMRKIEAKWRWKVNQYPHYENVGVEDLTFLGHSKDDFKHHGSADDDGAFKPIQMIRLTNSWMRRVNFESVSEAHSFVSCANVSAYDIEISGNRGHSAIRSQASSRVFIGKVYDHSDGKVATDSGGHNLGDPMEGAGQYHGCGVSKQSMGAVIWNVRWGDDSCFESHATQPRATLIDICQGGFVAWREGGDDEQLPNHLNDLTIWNMNATRVVCDAGWNGKWIWWDDNNIWWKNMPPIIVGWNGTQVPFDTSENQIKYYESLDAPVSPNSLYEAQLKRRLGYVPGWLSALK